MEDTSVIRNERANIFAFYLFVCFKKPVEEAKTKFAIRFFNWAIPSTQHNLFMILIKFENHDKTSSKTEKSLFLLL